MKFQTIPWIAPLFVVAASGLAFATPSSQIWNPSTDVQPYQVWHLGLDNYIRLEKTGAATNNTYVAGVTVGVLPSDVLQWEIGLDYIDTGTGSPADDHPVYFNSKLGIPENAIASGFPALAIGGYNFGTKAGITTQNIGYLLLAKTLSKTGPLPPLGRVTVGYYRGSRRLFLDDTGAPAEEGIILTWDRTMTEISDRLWFAVDYAGGRSANGALNFGFAWAWTKSVSVIFGYGIYNNARTGGKPTLTTQLDINFP